MNRGGLAQRPGAPTSSQQSGQYRKSFYDKILPPVDRQEFPDRRVRPSAPSSIINFPPRDSSRADSSLVSDAHPIQLQEPPASAISTKDEAKSPIAPESPLSTSSASNDTSDDTPQTQATSLELPPLQTKSNLEEGDPMHPFSEDVQGSFDLVAPPGKRLQSYSLETRSEELFSRNHLEIIFSHPSTLLRFTTFLSAHRPQSVPMLIYYLDALKALKAIRYSNAVAEALSPIQGYEFTKKIGHATTNEYLEERAAKAFTVLTEEDLPAYITHIYIRIVSLSISRRIVGSLPLHLREASEGLAEVFCLTDPSRPDNPIVFASEEFNRTTQYGLNYVIGRNCRFLQGPKTNPFSVKRIRDAVHSTREHCEVFLNYRRDGSAFMNLLMIAPLCDSRGNIRYFIGAQVDVSGLVKDCTDLESLRRLVQQNQSDGADTNPENSEKDDFQDLCEMLNLAELETARKHGGKMHREYQDDDLKDLHSKKAHKPRLLLKESLPEAGPVDNPNYQAGKLRGIYQNYLLIRPYPSFRILFASPSLRVPGILQTPFMEKIGGSTRVRNELNSAFAEGRGVTAKIRWLSRPDEDGRNRWIHCTPLIGSNGHIGVWMIVLVDDDLEVSRKWRQAPPVPTPQTTKAPPTKQQNRSSNSITEADASSQSRNGHSSSVLYDDVKDIAGAVAERSSTL